MCERKAEFGPKKNLRFQKIISGYVWIRLFNKHISNRHRWHKEMVKNTTTITKPHGLFYFDFFFSLENSVS